MLATYIVLNLFIAVAVEALEQETDEEREELRQEVDDVEQARRRRRPPRSSASLADLKGQVAALEARLPASRVA